MAGVVWLRRDRRWDVWDDPAVDPGASLFPGPLPPPSTLRAALEASDLDRPWRAPLRPHLPPADDVPRGLAAELLVRAGHLDEAVALAASLPDDDPAACFVRHWAYRRARDAHRAEAALVAATALATHPDRERYLRALRRWRRDHPRRRRAAERLWDPE